MDRLRTVRQAVGWTVSSTYIFFLENSRERLNGVPQNVFKNELDLSDERVAK